MSRKKQIGNVIGLFIVAILASYLMGMIKEKNNITPQNNNGTIIDIPNNTGYSRNIELDPITNINNAIISGKNGINYISIIPNRQPNLNSPDGNQNNEVMFKYMYGNQTPIHLKEGKNGYIIIETTKEISQYRNIFLSIRGKSGGILHKEKGIIDGRRYIFDIRNIPLANYKYGVNLYSQSSNGDITIGAVVGEKDNYIEKISIVYY